MKEKINQFAKGIFQYTTAPVVVEPGVLDLEVESGQSAQGSFELHTEDGSVMKGVACSDSHFLEITTSTFHEAFVTVSFCLHGENSQPGEVYKGNIRVITDHGSLLLPFKASVNLPCCTASTGQMKDLFRFANLAKENPQEAVRLFCNPQFEEIFLYRHAATRVLYRGLLQSEDKALALEEFLIAVHKKVPIQLSLDKSHFLYEDCEEQFMEHIVLKKDTWGMCEYQIQCDAAFVEFEQARIRTGQFVGNQYSLAYVIHPERMHAGINYARVTISNPQQTLQVVIQASKAGYGKEIVQQHIQMQKDLFRLYSRFIELQLGECQEQDYIKDVERIVCSLERTAALSQGWLIQEFRIHLNLLTHREESVTIGMQHLEDHLEEIRQRQPVLYCGYYYLLSLWKKDEEVTSDAVYAIRQCYQSVCHDWKVLWILLQIDETYDDAQRRQMEDMMEQLQDGCISPLIYVQVCKLFNQAPEMLMELNGQVQDCLHWGCQHERISKELAQRYTYLIGRMKQYTSVFRRDLCHIYETYEEEETLAILCRLLMMEKRVTSQDEPWYALGIQKNLKLTDLYEHYMYSLGEDQLSKLPASVLLYFMYNNHLNASKKAALYAYVIKNKIKDMSTYQSYKPLMQEYAMEQLEEGRISSALAVLYEEFIKENQVTPEVATALPKIMFTYEITCYNTEIVGVYVSHRELVREEFAPLIQGRSVVSIFTEQARIYLVDARGNRYLQSIDYTSNKLLHLDHLADRCLEYAGDEVRLLLHLYEKADSMNQTGGNVIELRKRVLEIPHLNENYKKRVFGTLIQYCFDNYEGELLDYQLSTMDWNQVAPSDRERFIDFCGVRHCFEKGMEGIRRYGYERVDAKRLLQISTKTFRAQMETEDPELVKLAWHIFRKGKYDDNIIGYLGRYFMGSLHEMVEIWKAADGFGLETEDFSERILAQAVFLEEMNTDVYAVFYSYYEQGSNKRLIRAFLKMIAYEYLVKGWMIPMEMFEYFYQEVRVEENRPCLLAALKYLSQKSELSPEEVTFAEYNIHQLYEKNVVLGFMKGFAGKISIPERISREKYVEYIADPANEVKIHYRVVSTDGEEVYTTQRMENIFYGIHVIGFVLFHDEMLQYYISETTPEGEDKITESVSIHYDEQITQDGSSWYHMLNLMMIAREMNDEITLQHVMEEYTIKKEMVNQLMKPL